MIAKPFAPWAELVPGVDREITADELLAWPEDGWQYELVDGRLVRMSPTGLEHSDVTGDLYTNIRVVARRLGGLVTLPDTGFRFIRPDGRELLLVPDVAYLGPERVAQLPARGSVARSRYVNVLPHLAIEVASPDQHRPEMAAKARLYLESGVQAVWVVWSRYQQIDVWRAGDEQPTSTLGVDDTLSGEDVLPGFTLPLAQLFN
jgi:Uma2 family endonuclease